MAYVACAYDQRKNLVLTVQTSPIYFGPGKPDSFSTKLPFVEIYNHAFVLAERTFGAANVEKAGKNVLIVRNTGDKVSTFLSELAGLARTLDTKLGS